MISARPKNSVPETFSKLAVIPGLAATKDARLSAHARFGIGGPADILVDAGNQTAFMEAIRISRESGLDCVVIGGGSNLIVADEGFRGAVLKFSGAGIESYGTRVRVEAGAVLQDLVDFTVDSGLQGLETMTGIPGWTGGAVYGNAGAYGHSISECVAHVTYFDGAEVMRVDNTACEFQYRESIFKRRKDWVILSAELNMKVGDAAALRGNADRILDIRNKKYPPTMKCAGSIFKNYLLVNLPPAVAAEVPASSVIEGKVPSAWFLERVGAKGMKVGDIHVADYHANLIYNNGNGTAQQLRTVIGELKRRVEDRWGMPLEEEVQYVGFSGEPPKD